LPRNELYKNGKVLIFHLVYVRYWYLTLGVSLTPIIVKLRHL